ncbi:MAG: helix-turn-helix transcriptional regulator [Bacteroidales bacterium]|nr:helix-turn-helix transcriptional regulator [Bacteroidales bacterium]
MVKTQKQKDEEQALKEQFSKNLKGRIDTICEEKGLSIKKLADLMGLGSDIALYTTIKKGNLRLVTLQRIADALGVEIVDLLSERNTEEKTIIEKPTFHCPHCGKEVALTLSAPLNQ